MDCNEFLHRYSDYDDSLLDGAELASFRQHLAGCAVCARYDRVLRKGRMLARQLPPPEPGRDFIPRLERRLWRTAAARRRRRVGVTVPGGLAAALAAVTVTIVVFWSLQLLEEDAAFLEPVVAASPESILAQPPAWSVRPEDPAPRAGWSTARVAPEGPASYSPLVTGPPAHRSAGAVLASAALTARPSYD